VNNTPSAAVVSTMEADDDEWDACFAVIVSAMLQAESEQSKQLLATITARGKD